MVSRQGRHLEQFRDKVQLFGIGDGEVIDQDTGKGGTVQKRQLVVKLWNQGDKNAARQKQAERQLPHEINLMEDEIDIDTVVSKSKRFERAQARKQYGRRKSQNKSKESLERFGSICSNESQEFKGDLEFLNKLKPHQLQKLMGVFRNTGRETVKHDEKAEHEGLWQPVVGCYQPNYDVVRSNSSLTLTKFDPPEDSERKA